MLKRCYPVFIFVSIALFGCKPEEHTPAEGEPIFSTQGTVDGQAFSITAGVSDYYMFTNYSLDTGNVFSFNGSFKTVDCDTICNNSLSITFRNYKIDANQATAFSQSMSLPPHNVFSSPSGTPTSMQVDFIAITMGGQASDLLWDFGDGTSSIEANPQHTYVVPGIYEVCLTANYIDGCNRSICNTLNNNLPGADCDASFSATPNGNTVAFTASPTGNGPFTYAWDFGDGTTTNTQGASHTYSSPGVYQVCLTTTSSDNCTSSICKNIATDNANTCSVDYLADTTVLSNPLNLATVELAWTDENGKVFTSKSDTQPSSSHFEILSIEDFVDNELGAKTKKLNVEFHCVLYHQGESKSISGSAIIAIAYP